MNCADGLRTAANDSMDTTEEAIGDKPWKIKK